MELLSKPAFSIHSASSLDHYFELYNMDKNVIIYDKVVYSDVSISLYSLFFVGFSADNFNNFVHYTNKLCFCIWFLFQNNGCIFIECNDFLKLIKHFMTFYGKFCFSLMDKVLIITYEWKNRFIYPTFIGWVCIGSRLNRQLNVNPLAFISMNSKLFTQLSFHIWILWIGEWMVHFETFSNVYRIKHLVYVMGL